MDGYVFKQIRIEQGKTLLDVYADTGIIPSTISAIENNRSKRPSYEMVKKLCEYFKLDLNSI